MLAPLVVPHARTSPRLAGRTTCLQAELLVVASNNLSGPVFPDAWLQPGALPRLESLELGGNPGLAGSLPANLSWPSLTRL